MNITVVFHNNKGFRPIRSAIGPIKNITGSASPYSDRDIYQVHTGKTVFAAERRCI
jgi:hypothetical protein